ncbi:MAG: class I SAM-dependent methyltransferase [Desulfomonilaceae bacterium]
MTPEQFQLHAKIEDSHWWFVGRRHIVEKIINASVPDKKQKILVDLGCGTGGNIGIFQDKFDCIGLDISEHAIEFARKRFPNITFISGGAEGTIYPIIEKADMVLLLDVLEHIENDSLFLKNLVTHMPSGSHLLVTAPANMSLWSPHDESHGHFRRYTRRQLQGVFAELPVSVRLLSYYNSFLYPVVKGIRVFTKFRGKTWGEACTDLSMPARPINFLLTELFASESRLLLRLMDRPHQTSLPFGVSVITLLRKV